MCLICAIEECKIAICNIPGAYLTKDWPEDQDCWIRFNGAMVDMLLETNPEYETCVKFFWNGNRVMYGKLKKTIYGILLSGLLFYNKLHKFLEDQGFKVNPYNKCTFNKTINNKQCTVQLYVDDLMIFHNDIVVLQDIIVKLKGEFGIINTSEAKYGKQQEYLGISINSSNPQEVKIMMYKYLEDILAEATSDMDGTSR